MSLANILLILILILLNGFFVAVEFAAVAARRSRLDLMTTPENRAARIVHDWLEHPASRDRLIAASQLGITVVSLALGAVGENTFAAWLEPYFAEAHFPPWLQFLDSVLPVLPLVISLIVVTSLHVVLGEQVPKVAVLRAPERFALAAAPFMQGFSAVFRGFINLLDWATRSVLRLLRLPAGGVHASVYTAEEIREIVTGPEAEGVITESERQMLSGVIDLGAMVVRQVTTPRPEIIAVAASTPLAEIIPLTIENAITKIPVYEGDLDHILGVVHLRDLVEQMHQGGDMQAPARSLVREALFVPETISVNDLLRQFRDKRTHLAIVLDEYGGTYGLVTLEDLLEEIVGDIQAPFDETPPTIQPLPEGGYLIDGMTFISEVNESLDLKLTDKHYDTIAGFMLSRLGRIGRVGDVIEDREQKVRLKVKTMDRLRIAEVILEKLA